MNAITVSGVQVSRILLISVRDSSSCSFVLLLDDPRRFQYSGFVKVGYKISSFRVFNFLSLFSFLIYDVTLEDILSGVPD